MELEGYRRVGLEQGGRQRDRHDPEARVVRRRKEKGDRGAGVGGEAGDGLLG